jgi:anti-sigma factor RsiW
MMHHPSTDELIDFIHGELSPALDAYVHAHLPECAACRTEYDREVRLGEAIRAAALAEESAFPSIVAAQIWERTRTPRPERFGFLRSVLRPVLAVPIAAALAAGIYFVSPLTHADSPKIEASFYLEQHDEQQAMSPLIERASQVTVDAGR